MSTSIFTVMKVKETILKQKALTVKQILTQTNIRPDALCVILSGPRLAPLRALLAVWANREADKPLGLGSRNRASSQNLGSCPWSPEDV